MSETLWQKNINGIERPSFSGDEQFDVLVVGGGLTGFLTSYLLSREGKRVAIIERDRVASGATAYTTAFLTYIVDTDLKKLIKIFGEENAKKIWQSHREAIDSIEKIINDERIECEFLRCPNYIYSRSEKDFESMREEAVIAKGFGFDFSTYKDERLSFSNDGYALVPNQAKFHPLKFLYGIEGQCYLNGVKIYENSSAEKIVQNADGTITVETPGGSITCKFLVISTYDPFNRPKELFADKGMYTSYVIEFSLPNGKVPIGIYEDTENPYNYFRIDGCKGYDRMILGGADHREEIKIDEEKNFGSLRDYAKELLPGTEMKEVNKWTGPILEPTDGIAYIGKLGEKNSNQYVAMGFSGNGMTYAMISASLISDAILGRQNEYGEVYDPMRAPSFRAIWEKGRDYTGEFFGGAARNAFRKA